MSQENVEIVRALYDTFNGGGAEAVRKLLDPDVAFKEPPEQPGATTFHGVDAVIEGFGKWSENWESHRIEPERLTDLGDRVLALEHHKLRGRDGDRSRRPRWQHLDASAREDHPLRGVVGSGCGPRSRRAQGVGDVPGERRDRAARV
jgi:uncharacterized protein